MAAAGRVSRRSWGLCPVVVGTSGCLDDKQNDIRVQRFLPTYISLRAFYSLFLINGLAPATI